MSTGADMKSSGSFSLTSSVSRRSLYRRPDSGAEQGMEADWLVSFAEAEGWTDRSRERAWNREREQDERRFWQSRSEKLAARLALEQELFAEHESQRQASEHIALLERGVVSDVGTLSPVMPVTRTTGGYTASRAR